MCDHCVIDSVKARMLDRRHLLRAALGTATVAASSQSAEATAVSPQSMTHIPAAHLYDLSHELHEDFPTFFGQQQFFRQQKYNYAQHKFNLLELRINEHTGTHIDAPLHFSADGQSVAEIPVQNLIAPLCVIDIRQRAADNADAQLLPDDIKAWTRKHGDIPPGACVAMLSGWEQHLNSAAYRGTDWLGRMHFPGFHVEAAQLLLEESNAVGLAVDTLSLDTGSSKDFATHYAWLPQNRWGLENLANLALLPPVGSHIFVGAPKHRGGTGGPCRVIALSP